VRWIETAVRRGEPPAWFRGELNVDGANVAVDDENYFRRVLIPTIAN
jgi:hypothetical protein